MRAFLRAKKLRPDRNPHLFGLGATLSLMKVEMDEDGQVKPEREGREHRFHLAVQTYKETRVHNFVWTNTAANRAKVPFAYDHPLDFRGAEDYLASVMMINLISHACEIRQFVPNGIEDDTELKFALPGDIHPLLEGVLFGVEPFVVVECKGGRVTPVLDWTVPKALLAGSFNPVHEGHITMRRRLGEAVKTEAAYEMAVRNADKPPMDYISIYERLLTIAKNDNALVYLTNAATFIEKSALFPNCTFGVGYDTAIRIVDPKYYGGPQGLYEALSNMQSRNNRFVVFGRAGEGEKFYTLNDINNPQFRAMAETVGEAVYRMDVSSSEIRKNGGGN